MNTLNSVQFPLQDDATYQLAKQFAQLCEDAEKTLRNLANNYQQIDPDGIGLRVCLNSMPAVVSAPIRDYLRDKLGMTIQQLVVAQPVTSPINYHAPASAGGSAGSSTPTFQSTPAAGKKKGVKRLLHFIKNALGMK